MRNIRRPWHCPVTIRYRTCPLIGGEYDWIVKPRFVVATVFVLVSAVACSDSAVDTTFTTRADRAAEAAALTELRAAAPRAKLSEEELLVTLYASCNAPPSDGPTSPLEVTKGQLFEWASLYPTLRDINTADDPYEDMGMSQRIELAYAAMGVESDETLDFAHGVLYASLHICPWAAEAQLTALNRHDF